MGMLARDLRRSAVRPSENDRHAVPAPGHVMSLAGVRDELVGRNEGKIPTHEFDDRFQPRLGSPDRQPGKTVFGNGGIDNSLRAPFCEHPFGHFVRAVIFGHFLADDEDPRVAGHLFVHGLAESFANLDNLGSH